MNHVRTGVLALFLIAIARHTAAQAVNVDGQSRVAHHLNHAEFAVQQVNGQSVLTLTGKVGTLTIGKIDGQSTLDASQLDADEIVVSEKVDGRSDLFARATRVTIELLNGQSILTLRLKEEGAAHVKKIDGQSRVFWSAPTNAAVTVGDQNGQSRVFRDPGLFK